jgi:hypothetical protein
MFSNTGHLSAKGVVNPMLNSNMEDYHISTLIFWQNDYWTEFFILQSQRQDKVCTIPYFWGKNLESWGGDQFPTPFMCSFRQNKDFNRMTFSNILHNSVKLKERIISDSHRNVGIPASYYGSLVHEVRPRVRLGWDFYKPPSSSS